MQEYVSVSIHEARKDKRIMAEINIIRGYILGIILAMEELRNEAGNGVDCNGAVSEERLLLGVEQE